MEKGRNAIASRVSGGILAAMILLFIVCTVLTISRIDENSAAAMVNLFLSIITITFTVLLYTFCIHSAAVDEKQKQLLSAAIAVYFLCGLSLLLSCGNGFSWQLRKLMDTLLFLLSSVYWLVFWRFQKRSYRHRLSQKAIGIVYLAFFSVYCVLTVINHFTGFCFGLMPDGSFVIRSDLLYILTLMLFVINLAVALLTLCPIKIRLILISYSLFPLLTWMPGFFLPDAGFYLEIFSNLSMFSYLIPLYLLFFGVYLQNNLLLLQREKDLEESRSRASALKISPHFIANTMSSIVALCYMDAPKAGDLAAKFARYLRDNYSDMTDASMIPFSKELEHIRNYLAVEQVRFPGLNVAYDIQADHFLLPTLTVQPLVENAVRHGISKRKDASGTVRIASFEEAGAFVVRIEDNGVGYHPDAGQDGKKHIGIANARTRLDLLCRGTLSISASLTQGTACEIRIPKEGMKK